MELSTTLEPTDIDTDEVLIALDAVVHALTENRVRTEEALERAAQIRAQRLAGWSYTQIVERSTGLLLVELLTANLLQLHTVGHRLRTAEARALRGEGLSTVKIAHLFGVSRQRIIALLRSVPVPGRNGDGGAPDD
jgi:hypothetical protein